jgi:hypothetical protein
VEMRIRSLQGLSTAEMLALVDPATVLHEGSHRAFNMNMMGAEQMWYVEMWQAPIYDTEEDEIYLPVAQLGGCG